LSVPGTRTEEGVEAMRRQCLWLLGSLAVVAFSLAGCKPVSAPPAAEGAKSVLAKIFSFR
jgi:hypothetical protein